MRVTRPSTASSHHTQHDSTYYGWYNGDTVSYYLDVTPLSSQPYTFTECVGGYLNAGGDYDVGGKNYAWSLKWTGHQAQGQNLAREHTRLVTKRSIEITRRFRHTNKNLAGIMPVSVNLRAIRLSLASTSLHPKRGYSFLPLSCTAGIASQVSRI